MLLKCLFISSSPETVSCHWVDVDERNINICDQLFDGLVNQIKILPLGIDARLTLLNIDTASSSDLLDWRFDDAGSSRTLAQGRGPFTRSNVRVKDVYEIIKKHYWCIETSRHKRR